MTTTTQAFLLAQRALVQFPRNPILLGFSVMPVLIMYQSANHIDSGVLRTIIELNPAEHVLRPSAS